MTWANIIQKVDKEKRPWGKASSTHLNEKPSEMWAEIEHE